MSKKKRPKQRAHNAGKWTTNDVRGLIHNPIYAGIGPFPAIIPDEEWIAVQTKQMEMEGEAAVFGQIRQALLMTFGDLPAWMAAPGWVELATHQCKTEGNAAYFARFLRDLRVEYANE